MVSAFSLYFLWLISSIALQWSTTFPCFVLLRFPVTSLNLWWKLKSSFFYSSSISWFFLLSSFRLSWFLCYSTFIFLSLPFFIDLTILFIIRNFFYLSSLRCSSFTFCKMTSSFFSFLSHIFQSGLGIYCFNSNSHSFDLNNFRSSHPYFILRVLIFIFKSIKALELLNNVYYNCNWFVIRFHFKLFNNSYKIDFLKCNYSDGIVQH